MKLGNLQIVKNDRDEHSSHIILEGGEMLCYVDYDKSDDYSYTAFESIHEHIMVHATTQAELLDKLSSMLHRIRTYSPELVSKLRDLSSDMAVGCDSRQAWNAKVKQFRDEVYSPWQFCDWNDHIASLYFSINCADERLVVNAMLWLASAIEKSCWMKNAHLSPAVITS